MIQRRSPRTAGRHAHPAVFLLEGLFYATMLWPKCRLFCLKTNFHEGGTNDTKRYYIFNYVICYVARYVAEDYGGQCRFTF